MKKILLTLLALLTVAPLLAQSDTLALGYCKGAVASEGMATQKGNTWVSAAIQLPGETMEAYQGNSVAQVRVALCSRSNIDTLRVWVRKTLKGENLAEGYITMKTDTRIKKGWNVVELNAPYAITGERLYIGFDLKQRGSTPALSVVKPGQTGSFHYKSTSDAFWGDRHGQGAISVEAVIVGNNLPKYDLALTGAKAMLNATTGSVTMSGTVFNKATRPVNKFTITTTVAGQKFATTFDKTITSGQYIDLKWTINPTLGSVDGESAVNVNITDLGDETDIDPTNNALDIAMGFKRKVLLEEFTTESCPNCPRVAGYLHTALENPEYEGEVFAAAHHVMYYTDWLTQPCDEELTFLFNNGGATFAPAVMFNREPDFDSYYLQGKKDNVTIPGSADDFGTIVEYYLTQTLANAKLDMQVVPNADKSKVTLVIKGEANNLYDTDNALLTVYVTEDNVKAQAQAGAQGTYKHHHVIRAYNSTWGDKVTWDGTSFTATYDYNLDSSWKQDDIKFVAFLNKHNANDPLDNRIENSINVSLSATNGVEGVSTNNDAVEVARYNAAGQRIYGQQKGLNIVKLSDGRTLKVIVK